MESAAPSPVPSTTPPPTRWGVALLAGGVAGTAVDVSLFPMDTLKTRLQSEAGFWRAGGFRQIYAGLMPVVLGSAPTAAIFFCAYETTKNAVLHEQAQSTSSSASAMAGYMLAASVGEVTACLVRVPVENVKQKRQANPAGLGNAALLRSILAAEGSAGLYRGYLTTLMRDVPFSLIQFPAWEFLKSQWSRRFSSSSSSSSQLAPWQSSLCGALAGGLSAALTMPFDVAKTRIMLAESNSELVRKNSTWYTLRTIWTQEGPRVLLAGLLPRAALISLGGAIFFGVYEKVKTCLL